MRKSLIIGILVLFFAAAGFICIRYYTFVFAKNIQGEILKVERVNQNETIVTGNRAVPASQLFSFAVAIRDTQGDIHTASSEDRQWAVAQTGQCAHARFFPYPPWDLEKGGTYYNARLIQLFDCPKAAPSPSTKPTK
ncbi:hypothetical protein WDW37_15650 [Bdellovibrionota bacterium FG-1]